MINKLLIPVVIILCSIAAAVWMSAQQTDPELIKPAPPSMLVDVMQARSEQVQITIEAQGSVSPRTQTVLVSEVSGLITDVSPAFVAGGFFKKGDVLIRIDDRNYRADVKRAQASVATAQTLVTRETGLADYAESDWQKAKPILSNSKAATDLALRKPQLAEARANLEFAEADLAKRQGDLDRTVIRAPYDGLVREKRADIGQYVAAGTQLAVTFATDIAEIRLPLPDKELPYLDLGSLNHSAGSGPAVTLFAEIGGVQSSWDGHIVRTEGVFDEKSRVLYLVAQIKDPYNQFAERWPAPLRIGTFVEAKIKGRLVDNIIKLPRKVLQGDDRVWTVAADNLLNLSKVNLLRSDESHIYVTSGINDGDLVCLSALDNPLPGTRVRFGSSEQPSQQQFQKKTQQQLKVIASEDD
ncbi:MAG: efflux RND transporter periplasmic adaptor subunit [Pseudomonadales bacterium]|nr:efflux RND transporter periplasmic adaptor subunit [Pseudomonadales bacterium]MDG1441624.1 efflux RND transporter periplasmic adaptor subunit [Pseudomonadales bacterium]